MAVVAAVVVAVAVAAVVAVAVVELHFDDPIQIEEFHSQYNHQTFHLSMDWNRLHRWNLLRNSQVSRNYLE